MSRRRVVKGRNPIARVVRSLGFRVVPDKREQVREQLVTKEERDMLLNWPVENEDEQG